MTTGSWPPLVLGKSVPRWVRVRDIAITLAAWALLAWWMRGALLLIWDWLSYPMFELNTQPAPDWPRIWQLLAPFLAISALLAAWLYFWSIRRRRILRRQLHADQPEPLELGVHAARFGASPPRVLALRERRIATVTFDASGRVDLQEIG